MGARQGNGKGVDIKSPGYAKFIIDFEFDFDTDMDSALRNVKDIVKSSSKDPYEYQGEENDVIPWIEEE